MLRRTGWHLVCAFIIALFILAIGGVVSPTSRSFASQKPELHLNRQSGPLGVTLTLNGTNFPPGVVNLSYIDSQNVPGMFVAPGDTSVQVTESGSFVTNNLILPASGAVGTWKIVVTDSQGTISTVLYTVLAGPGQTVAGAPTLAFYPTSGIGGDPISFTGSNWLPKGTTVNLLIQTGTGNIPLLEPAPLSDDKGNINGSFHLPLNLSTASVVVVASDASTGALHTQATITIGNVTVTPTASPTATASPTSGATATSIPTATVTSTPVGITNSGGSGDKNTGNPLGEMDAAVWGPVLLGVGAVLAIAALMLVLFMIPWGSQGRDQKQEVR